MKRELPNYLTFSRFAGAIPLMFLLLLQYHIKSLRTSKTVDLINFSLYIVFFMTDVVDGYLARRWKVVSSKGILLDPVADKFLALGPLYILLPLRDLHPLPIALISLREIGVMGLRTIAIKEGVIISASYMAKLKTSVINLSMLLLLLNVPWSVGAGKIFLWIASIISLYSGIEYFYMFFQQKRGK